jgi:catechol 2,3-dioxygenase-like lactoylglutathione lyase family enzyme
VEAAVASDGLTKEETMERAIPILPVEDLEAAKDFYVDRLGFDVRFEHRGNGKDGLPGVEMGPTT